MQPILIVGIIIFTGFIFGEIAEKFRLPKVTGYILAGVLLNPEVFGIIPKEFPKHTGLITNIALSLITFSIGGTLFYPRIKKLGRSIICITIFEAEIAFFMVAVGFLFILPFFTNFANATMLTVFVPASILIASVASPTDPAGTLAVVHEYKAKGDVTSTIMSVAAFDDVTGIINYSVAVVIANALLLHKDFSIYNSIVTPFMIIFGAVLLGAVFGFIFNFVYSFVQREDEGVLIVLVLALLSLCFGIAYLIGVNELLATMTMGIIVVNFSSQREKIFGVLGRYAEELIFVLFFTISGMILDFKVLAGSMVVVLFFVILRTSGKVLGTFIGAHLSSASDNVKRYTAGGLIPQGGIVIGLALMIKQNPAFSQFSDFILSLTIGATIIHEFIGPISAKMALKKAGEIK